MSFSFRAAPTPVIVDVAGVRRAVLGAIAAVLLVAVAVPGVALGAAPPTRCANDEFRTGPGATLPDCRAYEQVSPVAKGGANIGLKQGNARAAVSGDAFRFTSASGLPGVDGYLGINQAYVARRGAGGWSTVNQLTAASQFWSNANATAWSDDLAKTFITADVDEPGQGAIVFSDLATGDADLLGDSSFFGANLTGFSEDGSKLIFETAAQLLPSAAPGVSNLYAWDSATQTLRLAGVLPDGSTPPGGSVAGHAVAGYETFGFTHVVDAGLTPNTISNDGAKAFFTTGDTGQIYVRNDPTTAGATTEHVSASQKTNGAGPGGTDPNGPQPATFRAATPDGSTVFFTSSEELTNDAETGTAGQGADLYSYDVASGELTDLTVDSNDPDGADVQGVLGVSDDGSYVYFAANGVLAPGGSAGDCDGTNDAPNGPNQRTCNIYVLHDDETEFIAPASNIAIAGGGVPNYDDSFNWSQSTSFGHGPQTARVTPDGRTLLFASSLDLTGYEHPGYEEYYRYEAPTADLTCVSCHPGGVAPTAAPTLTRQLGILAPNATATLSRNLSSSGDRVFFESADQLLATDTNSVVDVYEWEAEGSGSCESSAQNGGCLYLLSTGRSPAGSYFADASVSGDDVFILTDDQLAGQDVDSLSDMYDVRVGGGLASQRAPVVPPGCVAEGCRGGLSPAPTVVVPGSIDFAGPGNSVARRTRLSVSRKAVRGAPFRLSTRVSAAGRLTARGRSIRTATRKVGRAGSHRLRIALTARAESKLSREKRLRVRFRVTFRPVLGPASSTTVVLTVKG